MAPHPQQPIKKCQPGFKLGGYSALKAGQMNGPCQIPGVWAASETGRGGGLVDLVHTNL